MNTCKSMQQEIDRITQAHHFDLSTARVGAHLRLEMPGFYPLVIEKIGKNLISVAHYFTQNSDSVADPEVVFFTGYGVWVPTEITQPAISVMGRPCGGWRECAELAPSQDRIAKYAPRAMADIASFARMWARNLHAQQWATVAQPA
jgi:hypothetical protein